VIVTSYLEPAAGQHEVGLDVVVSDLVGECEAHRAIRIVDLLLGGVNEYCVGMVYLLELNERKYEHNEFISGL